jgi:Fe-S cluster biogenesis protein NfuA
MMIETQTTPDKNVINFFVEEKIMESGRAEFFDENNSRKSPLAEKIFSIDNIQQIFITEDMVSVTKKDDGDWDLLKPQIMAEILDFFTTGEKAILEDEVLEKNFSDVEKQIIGLIDARIRPAVQQDGGNIAYKGFRNGIVYVEMQGSCIGCPYASVTLKDGVEKLLKKYIPEVKSVEAVS